MCDVGPTGVICEYALRFDDDDDGGDWGRSVRVRRYIPQDVALGASGRGPEAARAVLLTILLTHLLTRLTTLQHVSYESGVG